MDRRRRGRKAALQDGECEAHVLAAPVVALRRKPFRAVHLLANVRGDLGVERGLGLGELVLDGVSAALGEKRLPVELEKLLLGEAAHQVRDVGLVYAVAEPTLEAVCIEEGHEELEVRFLPVVGRRRHQDEVPRAATEELSQLVALRVLDLATEEARRHPVGLVADDKVPFRRRLKLRLDVGIPGKDVEPRDEEASLGKRFEVRAASICSLVRMSNGRPNFS